MKRKNVNRMENGMSSEDVRIFGEFLTASRSSGSAARSFVVMLCGPSISFKYYFNKISNSLSTIQFDIQH
jgi:hypothetical protein